MIAHVAVSILLHATHHITLHCFTLCVFCTKLYTQQGILGGLRMDMHS